MCFGHEISPPQSALFSLTPYAHLENQLSLYAPLTRPIMRDSYYQLIKNSFLV